MKVYKRALSLILALSLLFPTGTAVFAEETSKYKLAESLLSGLGIIGKNEADVSVTRGKFADVFAKTLNVYSGEFVYSKPFNDTQGTEYYEAIEMLHFRGYINGVGDNNFAPDSPMRVEDIARLYICALGLETYPERNNMTFWTAANRLGLLKNVSYTDGITMHNLIIMTYNLLVEAPVGKINFSGDESFTLDSNDNLLYEIFEVKKEKGMVCVNSSSGVWSTEALSKGYVKIALDNGTITALEGDTDIAKHLGRTLNIYIEYGDDDNRVVCYEERDDSDICRINIADIYYENSTLSRIEYTTNGTNTKRASVAAFPSVIFNGVYYDKGTFDIDILKDYEGTLTLIKSGNGSDYDIISITAYTDYFVSNVEYYEGEMRIFDKGANSKLILNGDDSEIEIYYPNGAPASMYELQANMLLTVMRSVDSKKVTIYISDAVEAKDITSVSPDERLIVTKDGAEYKVSASYPIENAEAGKNATLYFDYLGNVGWIETDAEHGYSYAIVCSVKQRRKEDAVVLSTFIKAGEFTSFTLAQKVNIDGVSCKNAQEQYAALSAISVKGFQTGTFPIRYMLNEDGQIKNIDTPVYNRNLESKDSLRSCLEKSKTTSGILFSSDGILGKQLVLSSSVKVFILPEDPNALANYDMFSVGGRSMLATGKNSNVMAFQTKDDSLYANLVVVWKGVGDYAELNHDNKLFLIDKITDVYDDGTQEIVKEVTGVEGGVEKTYRTYSEFDKSKLDGLTRGDVVRFAYYNGAIYNVQVVFQKDPTGANLGTYNQPSGANGVTNNEGNYDMYYCGYVRDREGKFLKIWTADITKSGSNVVLPKTTSWKNDDVTSEEYRVVQATNIAVYDSEVSGGKVYVGDIEDIPYYDGNGKYAVIIMRYRSRSPQEIVVIK